MAIRFDEYTEQLARVAQTNFLEGLSVLQKAQLLSRQNDATVQTLTEFNRKKNLLDEEVKPTEQQIQELKDTELFKGAEDDITKTIVQLQSGIDNSLARQEAFTKLSQTAALQLESIGSERSIGIAKVIRQQDIDQLEMKKTLFEIQAAKLNNVKYSMEIAVLQKNNKVSNLAVQMIGSEEFMKLKESYFYRQTYPRGMKDKNIPLYNLEGYFSAMKNKFGDNEYFREAFALAQSKLGEPLPVRPENVETDSTGRLRGIQQAYDNSNHLINLYDYLSKTSGYIANIENNPNYKDARQAYYETATKVYGVENAKNRDKFYFGSDAKVIAQMSSDDTIKDLPKQVLGEAMMTPTELALWIHNRKWNKESSEYYFDVLKDFRKRMIKEDRSAMNYAPYIEKNGAQNPNRLPVKTPFQILEFDMSKLMSNDEGRFYQPSLSGIDEYFYEDYQKDRRPLEDPSVKYNKEMEQWKALQETFGVNKNDANR